jgi:hypothetical protein
MVFTIAWPNGTRTRKKLQSLRELDDLVAAQFALGLEVDLQPTADGPLLIIGDSLFAAGTDATAAR